MAIVLIGPPAAGKTTAAAAVARALGRDVVHFDTARAQRYARFGYTGARADRLFEEGGARALHRYEARFEARALAQEAERRPEAVLDTGGGLLLQYADVDARRVGDTLAAADLTVLVLPHAGDRERSTRCLVARVRARGEGDASTAEWLDRGGERLLDALVGAGQAHVPLADLVVDTAGPVPTAAPGGRPPGTRPPASLVRRVTSALADRPVRVVGR